MGTPYNNIDTRLETALAEVLTESISGGLALVGHGVIITGLDDEVTEENRIICQVDSAEELNPQTGIWNVNCIISIFTNMDTTPSPGAFSNHKSNVALTRDLFMDDALAATLTATDANIIVSGITGYKVTNEIQDRFALGTISFGVIASGK